MVIYAGCVGMVLPNEEYRLLASVSVVLYSERVRSGAGCSDLLLRHGESLSALPEVHSFGSKRWIDDVSHSITCALFVNTHW